MRVSPPITVLAILAVMLSTAVWWTPSASENTEVTVRLPIEVYNGLAQQLEDHAGLDGQPRTMAQAIEQLASQAVLGNSRQ